MGGDPGAVGRYRQLLRDFLTAFPKYGKPRNLPVVTKDVRTFAHILWEYTYSHSQLVQTISAIDALHAVYNHDVVSKRPEVKYLCSRFSLNAKRYAERRKPILESDLVAVLEANTPRVSTHIWKTYIYLIYTFLLRHGEGRWVKPSDLEVPKPGQDPVWRLTVTHPKVGKEGWQTVIIPDHLVPEDAKPFLYWFAKQTAVDWDKLVPRHVVCSYIRIALGYPDDKGFCVHSLRHGRCTDLFKRYNISIDVLQKFGRWLNRKTVNRYIHC